MAEINRTVPGLARGIFKEVGVLTDVDIDRYTMTLANPMSTPEQIEKLHEDTMRKIDDSMKGMFDIYSKLGYDLGDLSLNQLIEDEAPEDVKPLSTGEWQIIDGIKYKIIE